MLVTIARLHIAYPPAACSTSHARRCRAPWAGRNSAPPTWIGTRARVSDPSRPCELRTCSMPSALTAAITTSSPTAISTDAVICTA
eukprot:3992137-Prymnesium_polylepis.1